MSSKYILIIATIITLLSSCTPLNIKRDFYYYGEFYPSFLDNSAFIISKSDSSSFFKIIVFEYKDTIHNNCTCFQSKFPFQKLKSHPYEILLSEKSVLSEQNYYSFLNDLDTFNYLKPITHHALKGLDGIHVINKIRFNHLESNFFYNNMDKSAKKDALIRAIFNLSYKSFKNEKIITYLENLKEYFFNPLPIKVISKNPLEITVYDYLYETEEMTLNRLIKLIPENKSLLIDITKLNAMDNTLTLTIKSVKENSNIFWVVQDSSLINLIGMDTNHVFCDLKTARIQVRKKKVK